MTAKPKATSDEFANPVARFVISAATIVLLLLLIWHAGRSGLGSLYATNAARNYQLASANVAVRLSPGNADAHYVRAAILETSDLLAAVAEYYEAVKIRPDDFALWLSLARARELAGDTEGAVVAAKQAIPLAPFYAQPHYQAGNILLRAGRTDEGFRELRVAGASNPALMPGIIDLAWRLSGGNVQFVQQAVGPKTPNAYGMLGQYFRQRQQVDAAIAMFTAADTASEGDRQSYVTELLAANRFREAARLWAVGRSNGVAPGVIDDPGFEKESDLNEPGFGWRLGESREGFQLSLDTANPKEGRTSLKIEFKGAANPASPIVSQLVLVDRRARYQLRFATRAEGIVSGGLPQVVVIDANAKNVLGQSDELPKATDAWLDYNVEFTASELTDAVQILVQRRSCAMSPCPIFGRLWLDNFSLHKL